jgi:very-short-patch-repair endonuclease
MGKNEALADGINIIYDENFRARGRKGCWLYEVPCENCGTIVRKTVYIRENVCLCIRCKTLRDKRKRKQKLDMLENVKTKEEIRFEKAVMEIKKQVYNFNEYTKPIEIARTAQLKYDSIPEVMVAIELLRLRYQIIPQQKIGQYKADFVIPKQKLIIEVDGEIYHKEIDMDREGEIQLRMGLDWRIIHVPAEKIRKRIQRLGKFIETFS